MINTDIRARVPTQLRVPSATPIRSIACGAYHLLAVSTDGLVYTYGRNEFGQLGLGNIRRQSDIMLNTFLMQVCGGDKVFFFSVSPHHPTVLSAADRLARQAGCGRCGFFTRTDC